MAWCMGCDKHAKEEFILSTAQRRQHIELNKGGKRTFTNFQQKHSILGLDFDFAYKELIWNKNYHFKSKNNQFMNILSFEQKFY